MQRMSALRKMYALLTRAERRAAWKLLALMLIGMVLDTLGISLVIPGIALLVEPNLGAAHPWM